MNLTLKLGRILVKYGYGKILVKQYVESCLAPTFKRERQDLYDDLGSFLQFFKVSTWHDASQIVYYC